MCGHHKNRWKYNQQFKLLFFKTDLHFDTSNEISSHKQRLLVLFFSKSALKTHTDQSIFQILLLCLMQKPLPTLQKKQPQKMFLGACFYYKFLSYVYDMFLEIDYIK